MEPTSQPLGPGDEPQQGAAKPPWADAFLAALSSGGSVAASARAVGITRRDAYRARDASPWLAAAWGDIVDARIDAVEADYVARATGWVRREVRPDGEVRRDEWDHRHARHVLEARRAETWRVEREDPSTRATPTAAPPVVLLVDEGAAAELARLRRRLAELTHGAGQDQEETA